MQFSHQTYCFEVLLYIRELVKENNITTHYVSTEDIWQTSGPST